MSIARTTQLTVDCCLWQWHIVDFVVHRYEGVCSYVYDAAKVLFKKCGKNFQSTHESRDGEVNVPVAKMKKWLHKIRKEARSEW